MKKFVGVIAGVSIALGMTACGLPAPAPTKTVTETAQPVAPEAPTVEEEFATLVRDNTELEGTTNEFVILAGSICDGFDSGMSFNSVVRVLTNEGISQWDAGYMIGASVGAYCDEHANKFE